jgi:hypothetical protein
MIPYLLLPSGALIAIQPAFMPDADILSLATGIHENALEIIHDRSLKAHGPSAQWSKYTLTKVCVGLPALFAHLPETERPPLLHVFCIYTKYVPELHFYLATLNMKFYRHMAPYGIFG